jgi:hypothetical protein
LEYRSLGRDLALEIPIFALVLLIVDSAVESYRTFTNLMGGGGHSGENKAKALLVLIILFAVVIVTVLVLAGPTTTSTGIFGNSTVSASWRNGAVTGSSIVGVILFIGAVVVLLTLL